MPDDHEPHDDISHLDFDVEDPGSSAPSDAPAPGGVDPRNWRPTEDVDDGSWVLSEEDQLLQRQLDWRRHRRGVVFRVAAGVVAVALLAVSASTLIGRIGGGGDGQERQIDPERLDLGPTSSEMAGYLLDDAEVEAIDPTLTLVPGNTDGSYDNLSLDELDEGGPAVATYGASAGVVRQWASADGRGVMIGIFLFPDRGTAARARDKVLALVDTEGRGGGNLEAAGFTLTGPVGATADRVAVRSIGRFLISFETVALDDEHVVALLEATSTASAAVH